MQKSFWDMLERMFDEKLICWKNIYTMFFNLHIWVTLTNFNTKCSKQNTHTGTLFHKKFSLKSMIYFILQFFLSAILLIYTLMRSNIKCNVWKLSFKTANLYNIYITHQPLELYTISECVLWVIFFVWGLLTDYLLIWLHGVVMWEYEIIFNTKCFIISGNITVLCRRNRSVVLTYIYIHTHTCSCLLESEDDRHTHIHLEARFFSTFRRASITFTDKYLSTGDLVDDDIFTPIPTLDCLHKHTFIFHAYRSVFLKSMQRYIWAWRAHFLVFHLLIPANIPMRSFVLLN